MADLLACFALTKKITDVEEARANGDTKDKLIAVGAEQDVSHALGFIGTDSELLHLSVLCDDAEFHPDLLDDLRKTPVIQTRAIKLSSLMTQAGYKPIFLEMDEKQQLIATNAMFRHMAKIADPDNKLEGFRKAADYLEAGKFLEDSKLLEEGISLLPTPLQILKLTEPMPSEAL